jgi:hypothetical protein
MFASDYLCKFHNKLVKFTHLEGPAGNIAGIEVKNKATITAKDVKGLEALKDVEGKKFKRGVLLYSGDTMLPFEKDIWAVPVNGLWE